MTPNQLVSYNLRRIRNLKGWTQQQTVEELAEHGMTVSRANFSLMESSYERETRIRNFTADDLTVFAMAFSVPLPWFFLPPIEEPEDAGVMVSDMNPMEYLDLVWPRLDLARSIDPNPAVGVLEKRLVALAPILGFDLTERVQAAVTPQAAKGVQAAMPTVLELVRLLDDGAASLQTWMNTLRSVLGEKVVDPVWAQALEAAVNYEGGEEE